MSHVQLSSGAMSFNFEDDMDGGPSVLDAADFLTIDAKAEEALKGVPEGGIAAPPLPTKDLFGRFNTAGKELAADWLLIEETPASTTPLLSGDLLAKLKQKQLEMTKRGGTVPNAAAAAAASLGEDATAGAKRSRDDGAGADADERKLNVRTAASSNNPELPPLPSEVNAKRRRRDEKRAVKAAGGAVSNDDDEDEEDDEGSLGNVFVESGFGDSEYLNFGDLKNQSASNLVLTAAVEAIEGSDATAAGKGKGGKRGGLSSARGNRADMAAVSVPLWAANRVRSEGGYCAENAAVALHQEIMDLVDFLRPTRAEVNMRRLIELEIQDICNRLFPYDGTEVCVYGSMSTHLMLPLSDLDMTILNVPVSTETALTRIAAEVGKLGLCSETFPQLILKTKVPLVKFEHRMSGIKVDISVNAADGRVNSGIVKKLCSKFAEAKYLILVIKYFLKQRDFDEPFKGGMGSFSTTLLVISFLQHHPIYNEDRDRRHLFGLGRLLVDFFRYYGNCFNFNKAAVIVGEGGCYYDRSRQQTDPNTGRPVQVIIEDPGNKNNNAASSLRNFPSIATSFEFAYLALTAVFDVTDNMSPDAPTIQGRPTLLSRVLHIDADMVRGRNVCAEGYRRWRASATKEERLRVKRFRFAEDVDMWDPFGTLRNYDSDAE